MMIYWTLLSVLVFGTCGSEAHVNHCGHVAKKDSKAVMDMMHFLIEENKACQCALEKLQRKLNQTTEIMKDCKEYYDAGENKDGNYTVSPDGKSKFQVYCDMRNGGWTVIQRRINGAVNFDHGWSDYVAGFGDLKADHWLGLYYIHLLARSPKEISFEFMMTSSRLMATAVYTDFQVGDASTNFKMQVSPKASYNNEMSKHITKYNGFFYQNGAQFSTKDRDNDQFVGGVCTKIHPGAWWYTKCYRIAQINAGFGDMYIWDTKGRKVSTSEVKLR